MSIDIYFYSGTGNSLFVARELQQRLPDSRLLPIAYQLRQGPARCEAEVLGLVFPLHGLTLPVPVTRFLRGLDPGKARYIFAIVTRGGSVCYAFEKLERLLKKKKRELDASFIITMFNNDPKLAAFQEVDAEEVALMEKSVAERLDAIKEVILKRAPYQESTEGVSFRLIQPLRFIMERLVLLGMMFVAVDGGKNYFYAEDGCTGCGTCARVCPSGKISMVDNTPVWQKKVKCHFCYACLNFCPEKVVQIKSQWFMKSHTPEHGRYSHPWAGAKDIAEQKSH